MLLKFKALFFIFFIQLYIVTSLFASDRADYFQMCLENKELVVQDKFEVKCSKNYHHYNALAYKTQYNPSNERVRIGSFNLWHPGQRKTLYKDYSLMARLINEFDIVGVQELQAAVSHDLENNRKVIDELSRLNFIDPSFKKNNLGKKKQLIDLYRPPGYLKLLFELRKIDPSWALMLSPYAEASKPTDIHELLGFFYRSKKVRPFVNEYCKQFSKGDSAFACFPRFDGSSLSKKTEHIFSRRPFMGNFESGHFSMTLLTTHVVYNSPKEKEKKEEILKTAFDVTEISQSAVKINKSNYARVAEVKVILDFMNFLKEEYEEQDIILMGDFNLEKKEKFWNQVLYDDQKILIDEKTSMTFLRFDIKNNETLGRSKNFDHFIVTKDSQECTQDREGFLATVYDYLKSGSIYKKINAKYKVRIEKYYDGSRYRMSKATYRKKRNLLKMFRTKISKVKTLKNGKIVSDIYKLKKTIDGFEERVLFSQLEDRSYYRFYHEVISDHLPIMLKCKTQNR